MHTVIDFLEQTLPSKNDACVSSKNTYRSFLCWYKCFINIIFATNVLIICYWTISFSKKKIHHHVRILLTWKKRGSYAVFSLRKLPTKINNSLQNVASTGRSQNCGKYSSRSKLCRNLPNSRHSCGAHRLTSRLGFI